MPDEPTDGEWWIVFDEETSEELRAQWDEPGQFWRIYDGETLGPHLLEARRRAVPGDLDSRKLVV